MRLSSLLRTCADGGLLGFPLPFALWIKRVADYRTQDSTGEHARRTSQDTDGHAGQCASCCGVSACRLNLPGREGRAAVPVLVPLRGARVHPLVPVTTHVGGKQIIEM